MTAFRKQWKRQASLGSDGMKENIQVVIWKCDSGGRIHYSVSDSVTTFPTSPPIRNKENEIMFYRKTRGLCSLSNLVQSSNMQNTWANTGFIWENCLATQPCPTLCDPMDCSPPGSSVRGISQARTLEWVAISLSRGSPWPRDQTHISCTGSWILHHWATRESPMRKLRLTEIKWFSWITQLIE